MSSKFSSSNLFAFSYSTSIFASAAGVEEAEEGDEVEVVGEGVATVGGVGCDVVAAGGGVGSSGISLGRRLRDRSRDAAGAPVCPSVEVERLRDPFAGAGAALCADATGAVTFGIPALVLIAGLFAIFFGAGGGLPPALGAGLGLAFPLGPRLGLGLFCGFGRPWLLCNDDAAPAFVFAFAPARLPSTCAW